MRASVEADGYMSLAMALEQVAGAAGSTGAGLGDSHCGAPQAGVVAALEAGNERYDAQAEDVEAGEDDEDVCQRRRDLADALSRLAQVCDSVCVCV